MGSAFFYDYNGRPPSNLTCFDANNEPTGACSCTAMSRTMDQRHDGDIFDRKQRFESMLRHLLAANTSRS